jgi:uncharacterized membrane protein
MRFLPELGILLIVVGFSLVFLGSAGSGNASVGGVVFIGPFPIVFGSGPGGGTLALLSVVIGGVMLALLLLWGLRVSRSRGKTNG